MIDAGGERHALRVHGAAGLGAERTRSYRAVGCGRRSKRRKRKNFEPCGIRIIIRRVEMNADENGIPRGIGDLRTNFEWDKVIA